MKKGLLIIFFDRRDFGAPDVKSASFELDLIWGQFIITVFNEDSEYVISFTVPQTVGRELGESWVRVGRELGES